jgi:hypothetical protein
MYDESASAGPEWAGSCDGVSRLDMVRATLTASTLTQPMVDDNELALVDSTVV